MAYLVAGSAYSPRPGDGAQRASRVVARAAGVIRRLVRNLLEVGGLVYSLFFTYQLSVAAWPLPNGDVKLYHEYALAFWEAQPRLSRLPTEYPPLSVLPFGLTLLPNLPAQYDVVFAYWAGALVVLGFLAFRRFAPWGAWAYVVYLLVGALGTLLARYDLFPALITLAALWAVERRRFVTAYVLVAASILLKLYPALLVPAVIIAQWQAARIRARSAHGAPAPAPVAMGIGSSPLPRDHGGDRDRGGGRIVAAVRTWRLQAFERIAPGLAICCAIVAVVFYGAQVASPQTAFSALGYASARPLQVESLPATVLWLGTALGIPAHAVFSFQSYNYVGPLDGVVVPLSSVAMLLGCLWIYWRQSRGLLRAGEAMLAVLCVLLATDKVFSPQYLIWVIPFVAAVEGFSTLWLAICALTTLDYPILYYAFSATMHSYDTRLMAVLALRNALLVYATLRAILRPPGARSKADVSSLAWRLSLPWTRAARGGELPPSQAYARETPCRTTPAGRRTRMGLDEVSRADRERGQQQKGIPGEYHA